MKGKAWRGSDLSFGDFGLEGSGVRLHHRSSDRSEPYRHDALSSSVAARSGLRLFPDKPITKKPAETRMGKGKGAPDHWVCVVRPGRILFEMEGVTPELAKEAMRLAAHKLPLKTTFVMRHDAVKPVAKEVVEVAE